MKLRIAIRVCVLLVLFSWQTQLAIADVQSDRLSSSDKRIQRDLDKFYKYCDRSQQEGFSAKQQLEAAGRVMGKLERKMKAAEVEVLRSYWTSLQKISAQTKERGESVRRAKREFTLALDGVLNPRIGRNYNSKADNEKVKTQLIAFHLQVDVLASPSWDQERTSDQTLISHCRSLAARVPGLQSKAKDWNQKFAEAYLSDPVYNDMLVWQASWRAGKRLCGFSELEKAATRVDRIVTAVGGHKGAASIRAKEIQKRAGKVSMRPVLDTNKSVVAAFRKVFRAQKWGEKILAIHVTSKGWETIRDPQSNRIVRRIRDGQIAVKRGSGCRLYDFGIQQMYNGSSYGRAGRSSHSSTAIACKNIP